MGMNDTSPEAERVLIEALRRMPFERKLRQIGELWDTAKMLHAMGFRERNPGATEEQIREAWVAQTLGPKLFGEVREARLEA